MATKRKRARISVQQLNELVAEATVDCYDEDEQIMGLFSMILENLILPFETRILGAPVKVTEIELVRGREIVAICRHDKERQAISLCDVPLPSPPPDGYEWVEAYRHWISTF